MSLSILSLPSERDKYDRTRIFTWLQSTQIGLDAFVDNRELVGFATELKTVKAACGVDLSIYPNGRSVSSVSKPVSGEGFLAGMWNWITGAHRGGPSDVEAVDADGFVSRDRNS
jgi:hypothetical protein